MNITKMSGSLLSCTLITCWLFIAACFTGNQQHAVVKGKVNDTTFTNPLLKSGPDPWVIKQGHYYYFTHTTGNGITIYRTQKMSALNRADKKTIWTAPAGTPYGKDIWAPEIHFLNNRWYVYFAADDGDNAHHRIYVLENRSIDPWSGTWHLLGKLSTPTDRWAIDATQFNYHGRSYLLWSGWSGNENDNQNLYIARLKNPWTIEGDRVMISAPTYPWERQGAPPGVNEGPEALISPAGKLFVTFSASGCWTDYYGLGLLSLKEHGDPMKATDWIKSPVPVFTSEPENGAFAPGHNGFFVSVDGRENWIIYHANEKPGQGCGNERNPRMQRFTWNPDDSPNFGEPVKINVPIKKPSGE